MYEYYRHYLNYQITNTAGKRPTADLVGWIFVASGHRNTERAADM